MSSDDDISTSDATSDADFLSSDAIRSPEAIIAELLPKLRSDKVTYFPVRHHSPACAIHIERWILEHKPRAILVEGPASFTERIERLVHEQCVTPVALYTSFVDKKGRLKPALSGSGAGGGIAKNDIDRPGTSNDTGSEDATKPGDTNDDSDRPEGGEDAAQSILPPNAMLSDEPARFAAYYPFCDYSPELVALRTGKAVGARLRFIDMEFGDSVIARWSHSSEQSSDPSPIISLAEDSHLRHSEYIKALVNKLGCRDFDELWDHLFETAWVNLSTDEFINRVAVYCAMARLSFSRKSLVEDCSLAREQCMAKAIRDELARGEGPVLVVTGGFHTVVLPDLVENGFETFGLSDETEIAQQKKSANKLPPAANFSVEEVGVWLMRYSFDKLDSLSGYASGMRSPEFYDRFWQAGRKLASTVSTNYASTRSEPSNDTAPGAFKNRRKSDFGGEVSKEVLPSNEMERVAADVTIEIGRLARERKLADLISTPDEIAAVQMAKQLSAMRGHPWPMREDVLDGIRACFIKGETSVEGHSLLALVREVLAGKRIGQVPPGGEQPPIVADLYRELKKFRIKTDFVEEKEFSLELYRNATHRKISRFFHRLSLLGAPLATYVGGPDFVTGQRLDLLIEHWRVLWNPGVESSLIESSLFGSTIEEAAGTKLKMQIADLEKAGEGRSSAAAVTFLIRACRLGLHAQTDSLIELIDRFIAEDPKLVSVALALSQLDLLHTAREPLEAGELKLVPQLMQAAFQRACRLLPDAPRCSDAEVDETIGALKILREILSASGVSSSGTAPGGPEILDRALFFSSVNKIINSCSQSDSAAIVGAVAGIVFSEGQISEGELIRLILGHIGGAREPQKTVSFLRGVISTACEVVWQLSEFIEAVDSQLESWDDETFTTLLPELRLAFSALTPREIARTAERISLLHDGKTLDGLVSTDLDEESVRLGMTVNALVRESLKADGLS